MEYVNRQGDRYRIFQGKTKTGKPKYFASKRETSEKGVKVASLPDEFEIFENPSNATVSVRRRKPSRVLPPERQLVDRLAVELSAYSFVQTRVDGDRIVIYTPDTDPNGAAAAMARIAGSAPSATADWTMRRRLQRTFWSSLVLSQAAVLRGEDIQAAISKFENLHLRSLLSPSRIPEIIRFVSSNRKTPSESASLFDGEADSLFWPLGRWVDYGVTDASSAATFLESTAHLFAAVLSSIDGEPGDEKPTLNSSARRISVGG